MVNIMAARLYTLITEHFEGKTTYIIGDCIINGCQTFHIDELDIVCNSWNVPQDLRDEVRRERHSLRIGTEQEYLDLLKNPLLSKFQDVNGIPTFGVVNGAFLDRISYNSPEFVKAISSGKLSEEVIQAAIDNSSSGQVLKKFALKGIGLEKLVDHNKCSVRRAVAKQGYGLEKLSDDNDWSVRRTVAGHGNKLSSHIIDKLIKDEDGYVRSKLAEEGIALNIFINDEDEDVRAEVAHQGYGLEILVNDTSWMVRQAVAQQGYGLETLINDTSCIVRSAVAQQGYGLDILAKDPSDLVRFQVSRKKEEL